MIAGPFYDVVSWERLYRIPDFMVAWTMPWWASQCSFSNQSSWIGIFVHKWFIAMQINICTHAFARTTIPFLRQASFPTAVNLRILYLDCDAFLRSSSGVQPLPRLLEHLFMKYALSHDCSNWDIRIIGRFTTVCREVLKLFCKFDILACGRTRHWKSERHACFYLFWIRKHQLATIPLELAVCSRLLLHSTWYLPILKVSTEKKGSSIYYVNLFSLYLIMHI